MSRAPISFRRREHRIRPFRRIMHLRRFPIGKKHGVVDGQSRKPRRVKTCRRRHRSHHITVEYSARHLPFETDIRPPRRNHQLRTQGSAAVVLDGRRSNAISFRHIRKQNSSAAPFCRIVDCSLNRLRVVGSAVAFGTEIEYVYSKSVQAAPPSNLIHEFFSRVLLTTRVQSRISIVCRISEFFSAALRMQTD